MWVSQSPNLDQNLNEVIKMLIIDSDYRYFVQDSRDLPNRVLCALPRSFHVLRQLIQHFHEDFLHWSNCIHNLPNAHPQTLLYNLWLPWRLLPSSKSTSARSCSASSNCTCRWFILGVCMVFFTLVGSACLCAVNHYAQQNQDNRKHDKPLRRMSRTLPLLLHPQLVSENLG